MPSLRLKEAEAQVAKAAKVSSSEELVKEGGREGCQVGC